MFSKTVHEKLRLVLLDGLRQYTPGVTCVVRQVAPGATCVVHQDVQEATGGVCLQHLVTLPNEPGITGGPIRGEEICRNQSHIRR